MAKVLVISLETLLDVKGRMLPVIFSSVKPVSQVWMFVRAALSQVCTSNEVGFWAEVWVDLFKWRMVISQNTLQADNAAFSCLLRYFGFKDLM